ncbi:MAG: 50S ribosome-binding GTPase [Planctomycetota bacterium]|nr:50S ribosome-binding GTPase [Planctomycetota bacterium]
MPLPGPARTSRLDDTIVAVSSPPGRSARGLVRLSGPRTRTILRQLIDSGDRGPSTSIKPAAPAERTLAPCRLHLPVNTTTTARAATPPTHPTPALLERLVRRIVDLGARRAEPGEFTFRAFVNGKLDLTQAEGVAATIAATSDAQLRAAAMLRQGRLGSLAASLVDRVANLLALVEAGIDFVDQDDVTPIAPAPLLARLIALRDELAATLRQSESWASLESLPRVVLAGPPSAGKSTLFNALLGRTRAVISPTPGTTRDVLAEPLTLPGRDGLKQEVMLVDIAGLDAPMTAIDAQAQEAARAAIDAADLILAIDDGLAEESATDRDPGLGATLIQTGSPPHARTTLRVRTKADLAPASPTSSRSGTFDLAVSARTGAGLDALRTAIATHVGNRGVSLAAETLALQPRHHDELRDALARLDEGVQLLEPQRGSRTLARPELIAAALRDALDHLACLGGTVAPDDVIGRVFATFCVGK